MSADSAEGSPPLGPDPDTTPSPAPNLTDRQTLTTRSLVLGLLCVGGLVGLSVAALPADGQEAAPPGRATPVEVLVAEPVSAYVTTRAYTGRLRPTRAEDLAFVLGGELREVRVSEGQVVAQGEVLARLDRRRLDAQRARLEAAHRAAEARLAELRAGPRKETIAAARARVAAADAQLALAKVKEARRRELFDAGVVTREELDEFRHLREARLAERDALARTLDELLAGTRQEQIAAGEASVAELAAQLGELRVEAEDRALRAPYAGTVGAVVAEEGAILQAGMPVLRFVERAPLEAWVGVPPGQVGPLARGSEQLLLCEGRPLAATVSALLPELDPVTRTRTVVLALREAGAPVVPEQVVRLVVRERHDAPGVWLPLSALSEGEREVWTCFVLEEGQGGLRTRRSLLQVLAVEPERALVSGLAAGERVVASGAHRLVAGQLVEPLP